MRRYVRKNAKMAIRKSNRKAKAKVARRVSNLYRFKRLTREVRIAHYSGAAANAFTTEDPANILDQASVAWPAESMPNTYQNQFACVHRLNQLEVPGDFTNLFDRYKITGVKATFLMQVSDAPVGGTNILPTVLYATDYDDNLPPVYTNMRQKQNVKQRILTANKPFSIFYRPRLSGVASANGLASVGAITTSSKNQWVDTATGDVDHYGLKFSINNMYSAITTNTQLEIRFTYYITMKDPQ